MSMVTGLTAAISNSIREIDEQISKLRSYQSELDSVAQRVNAAFSGSTVQYEQQMLDQLSNTKEKVNDTLNRLENAKEKLLRVQMI